MCIGVAQFCLRPKKNYVQMSRPTDLQATVEQRQGLLKIAFDQIDMAKGRICSHRAVRMFQRLSDVDGFLGPTDPLGQFAHLSKTEGTLGTGSHGDNGLHAERVPLPNRSSFLTQQFLLSVSIVP